MSRGAQPLTASRIPFVEMYSFNFMVAKLDFSSTFGFHWREFPRFEIDPSEIQALQLFIVLPLERTLSRDFGSEVLTARLSIR